MRGIDRVLAVLLLLGAVGGAAAFARQSGSESTSPSVALAAPPLQHPEAPGTFFLAPGLVTPADVAPAHRVTNPQAAPWTPARAVQPQSPPQPPEAQPPAAPPAPAPVETPPAPIQTPAPAAAQTPEPPRVLAAVAAPAAEGKSKGKGHGHAWGHLKHDDSAPAPEAPVAPTDIPVVTPSQDDPAVAVHGNGNEGHGNDNANDSGNDHGHGSGNDKSGGPEDSGD
jgi:outer membrane biosynthesis protein TonB